MNETVYDQCDMCGCTITDKTKCGYLSKDIINHGQYNIVVCAKCYDNIERYINEYGMINGYTN